MRRISLSVVLVLFAGMVVGLKPPDAGGEGWKAGSAVVEITPVEPMWMSGYASRSRPSEGTLTPLWAKALVLEDAEGHRVLLVTMDLIGMDRRLSNGIRDGIRDKFGFEREDVMLNFSHTHTGPVVGANLLAMYDLSDEEEAKVAEYAGFLKRAVTDLAGKAIGDMGPSMVSYGQGEATFAVNRRNNPEREVPALRKAGKLKGPVDHAVPVLQVVQKETKKRTAVFGYACHATVLSFFKWSGDYPGFAQKALADRYPNMTAMFWAGCGGDQNPLPRREVDLAKGYGKRLADSVAKVLDGDAMNPLNGPIRTDYNEIPLAFAEVPDAKELEERRDTATNKYNARAAAFLLGRPDVMGQVRHGYPYPVQTWTFGDDLRWVSLGGEVVVDYALRIKREFSKRSEMVWVAGYCNDVMAYIPSLRVLREGGYEGGGSMRYYGLPGPWAKDVEDRVMAEVLRQSGEVGGPGE